jgi:hypothetical protein
MSNTNNLFVLSDYGLLDNKEGCRYSGKNGLMEERKERSDGYFDKFLSVVIFKTVRLNESVRGSI